MQKEKVNWAVKTVTQWGVLNNNLVFKKIKHIKFCLICSLFVSKQLFV